MMRGYFRALGLAVGFFVFSIGIATAEDAEQNDPEPPVLPDDPASLEGLQLVPEATVTLGRLGYNRVTRQVSTSATIRNTSAELIELPYYVTVEQRPAGSSVPNADFALDDGTPVYRVVEALAPGDTATVPIVLQLTGRARILFAVRVYVLAAEPEPDTPPPAPTVSIPESPTASLQSSLTGTAVPNSTVRITGGPSVVSVTPDSNGDFAVTLDLEPNKLNRFFFSTVLNSSGLQSPANPVEILQDVEAPFVYVDFPLDGDTVVSNADVIGIGGRVGDRLSGFMGLSVKVNGLDANVVIGLGQNGTWELADVPLLLGANLFTVVATDELGNTATESITVTREEPVGPHIEVVSGNPQTAGVYSDVAEPLKVVVLQGDNSPFANKLVTFQVVRSDGVLSETSPVGDSALRNIQVLTDAGGEAQVYYKLGGDAGCANNRVRATSSGVAGEALFCASAQAGTPDRILVEIGDGQIGEVDGPACIQLSGWVNDACNGVPGIAVSFRVVQGGGKVNGVSLATVNTDATGHARVSYFFGPTPGTQVVEANFVGNPGLPAAFTLTAIERDLAQDTSFRTYVRDNGGQPLGGAECTLIVGTETVNATTDAAGLCEFPSITEAGAADLYINGLTANTLNGSPIPVGSFPSLHFEPVIIPNAVNQLGMDVLLPELDPANAVLWDGQDDVVLTVAGLDGFSMTVKAGSMTLPDSSVPSPATPAILSLNPVDFDKVPMPMPDGADPVLAWTLQPGGATFNPPVAISYPNTAGLPPGAAAYFLSFDHDTGMFEIVASASVDEQGLQINSDPGSGITVAGWGCQCPPYSQPGDCENCQVEITAPTFDPVYVCPDAEVTFTATGSPEGGTYSWTGGTAVGGSNGATYKAKFPEAGNKTITVTYTCPDVPPGTATTKVKVELKTNTVKWTQSVHPDGGGPNAVTLFTAGAVLAKEDNDGPGDGGAEDDTCVDMTFNIVNAAKATFPDQTANTFPANERFDYRLAKYNEITNNVDRNNLLRAGFANIKLAKSGNGWTGVAFKPGHDMILNSAANSRTAIHEFGHAAGLDHRDSTNKNIMYSVSNTTKNELNRTERDTLAGYVEVVQGE